METVLTDALLAPLAALILSVLSVWINGMFQRRSKEYQRRRRLSEAREEVEFLDVWLRAHEQVAAKTDQDPARFRANEDLERAYSVFTESFLSTVERDTGPTFGQSLRQVLRSVLLIGRLDRTAAKVVRVAYYFSLVWAMAVLVIISTAPLAGPEEDSISGRIGYIIGVAIGAFLMGGIPALLLRYLALHLDRRSEKAISRPPPSSRWHTPVGRPHLTPQPPPPPPPPAAPGTT